MVYFISGVLFYTSFYAVVKIVLPLRLEQPFCNTLTEPVIWKRYAPFSKHSFLLPHSYSRSWVASWNN